MRALSLNILRILMGAALLGASLYGAFRYWETRAINEAANSVQSHIPCEDPARLAGCDWSAATTVPVEASYVQVWLCTILTVVVAAAFVIYVFFALRDYLREVQEKLMVDASR